MRKIRTQTWIAGILVVVAFPFLFAGGLWVFMSATARPVHPNPRGIPSVPFAAVAPKWAGAVEQARQIVRGSLTNVPGLSVAVGIRDPAGMDEIVWAEGFGYADLKDSVPVLPKDRFRIGSASTVLTSAAAGLLLEDGRLKLDGEVQTYVPQFPRKQWPVTLREVMGHTAGVVPDEPDESPVFGKHCSRPVEGLQFFREYALMHQPGTQYRFSNYDWVLMSAAIEAATKQPYLEFMRERVFEPLGMHDTIPESALTEPDDDFPLFNLVRENIFDPRTARRKSAPPADKTVPERVTGYFPRFAADIKYGLHLVRPLDYSCYAGSSVFLSTPSDLVRFAMAINSGKLLKPETVQLMQTSQRLASGKETGYGLGWDVETVTLAGKQTRVIGHDGNSLGGMVASLMTFPEYGIVVAVTSNISYSDTAAIGRKIAEAFVERRR